MIDRLEETLSKNLLDQSAHRNRCEKELLAIVLIAPTKLTLVGSIVSAYDFYDSALRDLFRLTSAMSLNGDTVSAFSVSIAAQRSGLMDRLGGAAEYAKLCNEAQNVEHAEFIARELSRLAMSSRLYQAAIDLAEQASRKSANPSECLSAFKTKSESAAMSDSKPATPIGMIIKNILHHSEQELDGRRISTGFSNLDGLVGGMFTKNLTLLGGRFGKGKSCLAAQLVSNAVFDSKSALIFSLEMSEREFTQRILSSECGVSMNAWLRKRNTDEQKRIFEMMEKQQSCQWWIDDRSHQTVNSIRSKCQLAKLKHGLDLVVIDNLQILSPTERGLPKDQQKKADTEELKRIAKDLDVCVVLLAQLDSEAGKARPNETSWATCKSIAGDADLAMMLHEWNEEDHEYELIVTKVRGTGERGTLYYSFDGEFQTFTESDKRPNKEKNNKRLNHNADFTAWGAK